MMERKDIYELLELYGHGGIPGYGKRKEQYHNLSLSRAERILQSYNCLYDSSAETEKNKALLSLLF